MTNMLLQLSQEIYEFLVTGNIHGLLSVKEGKSFEFLLSKKIINSETEDDDLRNILKINYLQSSYQTSHMNLTLLPTEGCNLRCPYCFETEKSGMSMSDEVIDQDVRYIKERSCVKTLSITWFGGEPLLRYDIIEKLLLKLTSIDNKKIISQSIVTNGTIINEEILRLFRKYPLDNIQFTIDGTKEEHNKKRFFAPNKGTYSIIINNIKRFCESFPNTKVSIRINVDKNVSPKFVEICREIRREINVKHRYNLNIYPGILKATGKSCDSCFFNSEDKQQFYNNLLEIGMDYLKYPERRIGGCTASSISSLVIGADGLIYRCWEDVGDKTMVVGSVFDNKKLNPILFSRYMELGSPFSSERCMECSFLPICRGGCPKQRMKCETEDQFNQLCCVEILNDQEILKKVLLKRINGN